MQAAAVAGEGSGPLESGGGDKTKPFVQSAVTVQDTDDGSGAAARPAAAAATNGAATGGESDGGLVRVLFFVFLRVSSFLHLFFALPLFRVGGWLRRVSGFVNDIFVCLHALCVLALLRCGAKRVGVSCVKGRGERSADGLSLACDCTEPVPKAQPSKTRRAPLSQLYHNVKLFPTAFLSCPAVF